MSSYNPLLYPEDYGLRLLGDATATRADGLSRTVACWTKRSRPRAVLCSWDTYNCDEREAFDGVRDPAKKGAWIDKDSFDNWVVWMNTTITLKFPSAVEGAARLVEMVRLEVAE